MIRRIYRPAYTRRYTGSCRGIPSHTPYTRACIYRPGILAYTMIRRILRPKITPGVYRRGILPGYTGVYDDTPYIPACIYPALYRSRRSIPSHSISTPYTRACIYRPGILAYTMIRRILRPAYTPGVYRRGILPGYTDVYDDTPYTPACIYLDEIEICIPGGILLPYTVHPASPDRCNIPGHTLYNRLYTTAVYCIPGCILLPYTVYPARQRPLYTKTYILCFCVPGYHQNCMYSRTALYNSYIHTAIHDSVHDTFKERKTEVAAQG